MAKHIDEIECDLKLNAEEALETTNELVSMMDDISPQVVIRGAKNCTFNIYPSVTKIYENGTDKEEEA